MSIPGVKTIKTAEVVEMLLGKPVISIDAQGWYDQRIDTLPGAILVDWAGTDAIESPEHEKKLQKSFEVIMQLIEPAKTQPVVVYCHSAKCWLSINAILRLQNMGYSNLYWYRGGAASWKAAGLPLIPGVPHATVWLPQ